MKHDSSSSAASRPADPSALDQLTGGAFSAPTSGERAARIREWLAREPSAEQMADVFRELSQRDKGAARPLKEKLDEMRRMKAQEGMAAEWADKAQTLLAQARLNVADAMAWQRDAAKAGAPLSREPLAGLKQALVERVKAIEDLQTQIQVAREAAVLLAQRIEVLSTKPLQEAVQACTSLAQDVNQWGQQGQALAQDQQWSSIDARFVSMLDGARAQLEVVWQAFEAALQQAQAAQTDAASALPAVPVWADEIRLARGEPVAESPVVAPAVNDTEHAARRQQATQAVGDALARVAKELEQGHTKALHKCVTDLRHALKEHGRWLSAELDAQAQALLAQAGDLEGWQKWRADQLRTELVAKAEQLTQGPEGQRLGGRKMQETLRALRDQWKQTDQGGAPNHALWKRFDEACTQAHKGVEAWLDKVRADAAQHRAQRLALLQSLKDWAGAHATQTDWKQQLRALHDFGEQWRNAGHLSEKQFAELQPLWKEAWAAARAPLDAAQAQSLELRKALIAQAQALGAAPVFRLDAVKALQHEWQAEAQRVPLDRKQEQKLWDAFRKPIDEAFERKSAEREKQASALSRHDQQVLAAAKALQEANASQDAQRIQSAMSALAAALRGESAGENEQKTLSAQEQQENNAPESGVKADPEEAVAQPAVRKPVVAVRGDDRPGMKKAEPAAPVRNGRAAPDGRERGPARRDGPPQRDQAPRFAERAPRLGDAAFRAQRDALEQAQTALKKLAAQAHGQTLTQLLDAWKARDAQQLPSVQELGGRLGAAQRATWAQALSMPAQGVADTSLLRLEMAAELPTPASHLDARRALQLQLLTRRNDPIPAQTWVQDAAQVLASPWGAEQAQRLQATLKSLIRRG